MDDKSIENLRLNLIHADCKTFGRIFEIIVSHLQNLSEANDQSYDRKCKTTKKRVEVKASRAFEKTTKLTESNAYELLTQSNAHKKLVQSNDLKNPNYDCGIFQVKPTCFEELYYCIVFHENVYIFKINKKEITEDKAIGYSKKQHRTGKMGQFHIHAKNIDHHMQNYLYRKLNYSQILAVLNFQK